MCVAYFVVKMVIGERGAESQGNNFGRKFNDKVDVCNQFILKDNPNSLAEKRRFSITCISCNNCGVSFV
jgi:hypothetical protein